MGELLDKAQAKLNDMENKAHELKGRAKQKKKDMESDQQHLAM
jgi:hypothetical protein